MNTAFAFVLLIITYGKSPDENVIVGVYSTQARCEHEIADARAAGMSPADPKDGDRVLICEPRSVDVEHHYQQALGSH